MAEVAGESCGQAARTSCREGFADATIRTSGDRRGGAAVVERRDRLVRCGVEAYYRYSVAPMGGPMSAAAERPTETPIGRRAVIGLAGFTAAGVLFGARAQRWLEGWLPGHDGVLATLLPAQRFRIYSVTGALPVEAD